MNTTSFQHGEMIRILAHVDLIAKKVEAPISQARFFLVPIYIILELDSAKKILLVTRKEKQQKLDLILLGFLKEFTILTHIKTHQLGYSLTLKKYLRKKY